MVTQGAAEAMDQVHRQCSRKAFGIVGNWKEAANNAVCWYGKVKAITSTTEWSEKEKAIANAGQLKEVATEVKLAGNSAGASGVAARQVIALTELSMARPR